MTLIATPPPIDVVDDRDDVPTCRICGCTDYSACVTFGRACHWVADDLCSACERIAGPRP